MEGVGARLGRSSARYGSTTVFTGRVRKWKKKWIHVTPPNSSSINNNNNQTAVTNDGNNGGSHLLLFKWTPTTATSQNNNNNSNGNGNNKTIDENNEDPEEPPKRKFKYLPVALLEEQKNEETELGEDEAKPMETNTCAAEPSSKADGFDEKPDINDVPAKENQDPENSPLERQHLNESTLDLSLGLKARDRKDCSDSKHDQNSEEQNERVNSSTVGT